MRPSASRRCAPATIYTQASEQTLAPSLGANSDRNSHDRTTAAATSTASSPTISAAQSGLTGWQRLFTFRADRTAQWRWHRLDIYVAEQIPCRHQQPDERSEQQKLHTFCTMELNQRSRPNGTKGANSVPHPPSATDGHSQLAIPVSLHQKEPQ